MSLGRSEEGKVGTKWAQQVLRSAGPTVIDSNPVAGNLVSVSKPKFITVVGKPANQTGFKIIRSSDGKPTVAPKVLMRTTKRSEVSPIMKLAFPPGSTEESVAEALKTYGLSEYSVTQSGETFIATRSDLKSISKETTQEIKLDGGLVATVSRTSGGLSTGSLEGLTLVSVEFDSTKFGLEDVQRWAAEKFVDGTVESPQNPDQCYVVRRSDVLEGEETRKMQLEDGVEAVVKRSDAYDIPDGFIAVINEAMYGGWGWGQLDFSAGMADQAFSEHMRDALRMLEDVLWNIVIYSPLPLNTRKELAMRSLAQFGEYVGSVMDSLPRQLLVAVARSANPLKENSMSKQETSGAATLTTGATTTPATEEMVKRSDVEKMIADALAAAAPAAKTEPAASTPAQAIETVTRAEMNDTFAKLMKPMADSMAEAVKAMQGVTVVRSTTDPVPVEGEKKDGKKDVFRGALPGLRLAASK